MHPLIFTLAFLTLLAALLTGHIKQFVQQQSDQTLYRNYFESYRAFEEERVATLLFERKVADAAREATPSKSRKSGSKRIPKLKVNLARPPDNSRLNLALFVHRDNVCLKEIAVRLITHLYKAHPLFRTHPHLAEEFVDALMEQKEKMTAFQYPDQLATLSFADPHLAQALYLLINGGVNQEGVIFPSLLSYISYKNEGQGNAAKINLMFAPQELLEVIFEDPLITAKVCKLREQWWDIILDQEHNRLERMFGEGFGRIEIKARLLASFEEIVRFHHKNEEFYKSLFDFSLSSEGTVLLVSNPVTKITTRALVPIVFKAPHDEE